MIRVDCDYVRMIGWWVVVGDNMINDKGGNDVDDDVPLVRAIHTKVIQT